MCGSGVGRGCPGLLPLVRTAWISLHFARPQQSVGFRGRDWCRGLVRYTEPPAERVVRWLAGTPLVLSLRRPLGSWYRLRRAWSWPRRLLCFYKYCVCGTDSLFSVVWHRGFRDFSLPSEPALDNVMGLRYARTICQAHVLSGAAGMSTFSRTPWELNPSWTILRL